MGNRSGNNDVISKFAFIDAARGWAFIFVLCLHCSQKFPNLPGWVLEACNRGNYGVQLFFIISALTLLLSYNKRKKYDRRPLLAFFIRRFFRIAPLFYSAAILYPVLSYLGLFSNSNINYLDIVNTMLFIHGWDPERINLVVPGGWSIAVEMNFYLLFPLLLLLLSNLNKSLVYGGIILVLSIMLSLLMKRNLDMFYPAPQVRDFTFYWLPRQMPVFIVGFILFHCLKDKILLSTNIVSLKQLSIAKACLSCGFIAIILLSTKTANSLPVLYFLFSIIFAIIIYGLAYCPIKILVNKISCGIGMVSFSAYITHFFVIHYVEGYLDYFIISEFALLNFCIFFLCSLILTLLVSSMSYFIVEIPGIKVGRRIINKLEFD